ncbi:MAG: 30S ribosomal protein S1 [Candidatus Marinimicrobia bacterium]|nr:30S ribosomal protein S1 [Candidatus Neomarinimicrobiota bacterium]
MMNETELKDVVNDSNIEDSVDINDNSINQEKKPILDYLDSSILDIKKYTYDQIDKIDENHEETSLEDMNLYNTDSFANISEKQLVMGKVAAINDKEVLVDIGFKSEGIIDKNEFDKIPEIGEEIEVFLVVFEDKKGRLILSKQRADFEKRWKMLREASENDTTLTGRIAKVIKGGLVVDLGVVNAFLPGSQLDVNPVSNFDEYMNKECEFKIVKFNEFRQNIVVSRKATMVDELEDKRAQLLEKLEVGSVVPGTVKNITDFGAFIDLGGGVDGLLHITDMTWGRINNPQDKVSVGEKIDVKIIDYDKVKNRISLGLKQLSEDPWIAAVEKYKNNTIISGKVVNMMNYGVFVEIEDGIEGLIHVSEISWTKHIKHPSEVYKIGDELDAIVMSIDSESKKISLGVKQMSDNPWLTIEEKYKVDDKISGVVTNLVQNGAFVNINNEIEGFLHINDISWTRKIKNPSDILKKNEELDLIIIDISSKDKKINLGLKQLTDDPWDNINKYYNQDDDIKAQTLHVLEKGIIFLTDDHFECMLPISKVKNKNLFEIGKEYDLKISEINLDNRRIVLEYNFDDSEVEESPKEQSPKEQNLKEENPEEESKEE